MHANSKTTAFIVDTPDYFAAHTDNGELRFGLVGESSFQISKLHEAADQVLAAASSDDVESVFDDFMSGDYGRFIYTQ